MTQQGIERRINQLSVPSSAPPAGRAPAHLPKTLLAVLWRQRWIMLTVALLALGVGWVLLMRTTPIFASNSRILVEQDHKVILSDGITASSQSANYLATQCELIKSSDILAKVADLPEIRSLRTFAGPVDPLGTLRLGVTAEVSTHDDLITVGFRSPYRTDAADIVNAVVEAYRAYYASRERSNAFELRTIMEKEKRDREVELAKKVQDSLAFRRANPELSFTSDKGNIILETLAKLSDALTTARLETLDTRAAYESAAAGAADPTALAQWLKSQQGASNSGTLAAAELDNLQSQLASMRLKLGLHHPSVETLEAQIADLQLRQNERDRAAIAMYVASFKQRMLASQQREKELAAEFAAQQQKALGLNTVTTTFASIEADRQRLEKLCDLLDTKIKELNVNAEVGARISVLEYARPGTVPVSPNRAGFLLQSLLVGLLVGGVLARLREWVDQRLTSADEIQEMLGLEILAVTTHMSGKQTAQMRGLRVQYEPMSETAEVFRALRTAVYFRGGESVKTILITSPESGDGKTTTASNLAVAMAQAGQKILLLDADCRRPSQHYIFGLHNPEIGLSTVLSGQTEPASAIQMTTVPGLSLLPCGPIPKNPAELLHSRRFIDLLRDLEGRFDRIVIDTTPVMSVTDASIVAAIADITILVLRAQRSTRRGSQRTRDMLNAVGAKILGVVVNDAPARSSSYGYGYRYGYRYGYGRYAESAGNGRGRRLAQSTAVSGAQ